MAIGDIINNVSDTIAKIPNTIKSLNLDNLINNVKKNIESGAETITEEPEIINNYVEASKSIINTYGIRQEIVIQNKKEDPKVTALRKLNDNCLAKETIEVEVLGDINYKVGYGVHVMLPFLKDYQDCFMYIKEVSNEWKNNGIFISTLTLTKSRVMDEQEWSDADESGDNYSSSSGGNSSSATAKSIIALLTQQIGKPYVWGATGPDSFDCSGLMYYCYNQFSDDLIDGKPISRTTYTQLSDGNPVDASDSSKWQAGDLVFPHDGHVLAYIGNGQFIHAPHTGDVVKTTSQYWDNTYAVRRVIAEDTTISSTDIGDIPSDYVDALTVVDGNCDAFISNMNSYGYKDSIISISKSKGVDPYIISAIIAVESSGNPNEGGSYSGLMQTSGGSTDPTTNIEQGVNEYVEKMKAVGTNQVHVILSAYNSGQGTVLSACKQNGYDVNTVTVKQLGDALYSYVSSNEHDWDANEKKYYSSKVIKAYGILKSKNALE